MPISEPLVSTTESFDKGHRKPLYCGVGRKLSSWVSSLDQAQSFTYVPILHDTSSLSCKERRRCLPSFGDVPHQGCFLGSLHDAELRWTTLFSPSTLFFPRIFFIISRSLFFLMIHSFPSRPTVYSFLIIQCSALFCSSLPYWFLFNVSAYDCI